MRSFFCYISTPNSLSPTDASRACVTEIASASLAADHDPPVQARRRREIAAPSPDMLFEG